MNIKTIDITTTTWWDKVNGNTYFSSRITLNYGMEDVKEIKLPFQYGYGSQDEQEAKAELIKQDILKIPNTCTKFDALSMICRESGIIYRHTKIENCKKKEVKEYGE